MSDRTPTSESETPAPPDFRALFEAAPGLYLVLNPDLKIVAASDAYLRATMTQRQAILGRGIFEVFPDNPDDPHASGVRNLSASLERVLRNKVMDAMAVQKYDIQRPEVEGGGFEERYWSPVNSPVFGSGSEVAFAIHRVEDVTEFVRLKQRGIEQEKLAQEMRVRGDQMEAETFLRAQELQESNRQLRQANEELRQLKETLERRVEERTAELTRTNEALRESEGRFTAILNYSPSCIFAKDRQGRYLLANKALAEFTGRDAADLLGRTDADIFPAEIAARFARDDGDLLASGSPRIFEESFPHDDRIVTALTVKFPLVGPDGTPYAVCGIATDISDLKRAQDALRESEERFRQLADAMPQIVWTARPDGNIDYLNRQWHEFTGLPETLGNEGWEEILHPDDARPGQERWDASVHSGAPFEMEMRLLDRRRQTYRWHLIRTVAVHDQAGKVTRWFGTSTDIHEQKRAEESSRYLAEASAALAGVVDYESTLQKVANLAVPYFADWSAVDVANDDGTLRRLAVAHQDPDKISLAHELMQQYPPDPQAPGGIFAVLRTGKPAIVSEITKEMLVQGARDERHLQLIRSLGLKSYICVPLIVSGNPLGVLTFATAESGRTYTDADLALANDLAYRAGVAIENTQLYQALREADRRKDEFLATLAHELRNPLAPIRNSLQILKMPRVDAATVERSREMMERQVHQLVRLVDDLLDVSRVMRGKIELRKESVELASIVARAVETAQPLIEAQGHELKVNLADESLLLEADPVRLAQVVGNLLTNAAKYTEANGRFRLTAQREGGEAVLRVRDTGIGIAPDMVPKVFDLFVQVDHAATRSQGGLGIGLTLVKNLVEMHHGTVEAHSDGLGRGSEFVIRLPLMPQDQRQQIEEKGESPPESARSSGHRLLVVDDNRDAADSLAMLLRLLGHQVQVAHDGPAALDMMKDYRPALVFLDIGMPGMDGYEVARRLRQQPDLENVQLAALTGWGQQEDRRRTTAVGFDHHLVKPVEPKALEDLLADLNKGEPRASAR